MENEENVDLEELDAIDTSEDGVETTEQQENTKTYSEEELQAKIEETRTKMKEENQNAWNKRWGQEKSRMERKFAKQNELASLLLQQTDTKTIDDLLNMSYEQYGVERPSAKSNLKDDEILGKHDAKEILELDDDMIEEEANRLAGLKRTAREEATFMELGNYLTNKKSEAKRKQEIQEAGIDEETANSDDFKNLVSKFNENVSIKDVYEVYKKMYDKPKEKPYSAGSLKGTKQSGDGVKDFYTYEESLQFTRKDFEKNPRLLTVIKNSMSEWGKKK